MKFRIATPRLLCRVGFHVGMLLLCAFASVSALASDPPIPSGDIRIHYHRPDGNYSGWTVYAFDNTTENTGNYGGGPVQVTGTDSYGAYFDVGSDHGRARSRDHHSQPNRAGRRPEGHSEQFVRRSLNAGHRVLGILWDREAVYNRAQPDQSHRAAAGIRPRSLPPDGRQLFRLDDLCLLRHDRVYRRLQQRARTPTNSDAYGVYFDVAVVANAQNLGLIIHNPSASGGDQKDPGPNEFVDPSTEGFEYWGYTGIGKLYKSQLSLTNPTALLPGYARIHYYRPDGNYANWTVYAFEDTAEYTGDYNDGLTGVTSTDSYGAYFDISLIPNAQNLGFIIHNISTGVKDPGPNMYLNVATYNQAWAISGNATVFTSTPTPTEILDSLLNVEQAYWLDRQRVAIQPQFAQSGDTYAHQLQPDRRVVGDSYRHYRRHQYSAHCWRKPDRG